MSSSTTIRCTLNKIPTTAGLLQRCRLPFGLHLYPFGGEESEMCVPVISDSPIVRCRACRTYINPYIRMVDQRRWQCNMCHRISDIPSGFYYDAHSQQPIDIRTRPELNYTSVEFMASTDYLVRPPQPACYMFVFERSRFALDIGYVPVLANCIIDCLDSIPGDARASIGFIAYDSNVHYYTFGDGHVTHLVAPDVQSGTLADTNTPFLPCPADTILVNIDSQRELIIDFLHEQLSTFATSMAQYDNLNDDLISSSMDANSALGPAIRSAYEVLAPIGGRITVIQAHIANCGNPDDGSVLTVREDPNQRAKKLDKNSEALTPLLNPATDYYKKLALECTEHHIALDLFNLSSTYTDLATVSSLARCSAGSVYHYSNDRQQQSSSLLSRFEFDLKHYLSRALGLEAVLRLRCSRGLSIHTFHGNFFVRSTDLLVLPNVNPDAGFSMQIAIDEDLRDTPSVCFQAAVLYTTPAGERRIRVHTASFDTVTTMPEVLHGADQEAVAAMLAKMAVDRSLQQSIGEANEALVMAGADLIEAYQLAEPSRPGYGLPHELSLIPLYILALIKHTAFRSGVSTKLDDRVAAMDRLKTLPLHDIVTYIYPDLYPVHMPFDPSTAWPSPLQLSAANLDRTGAYLLDTYDHLILYVCQHVHPTFCESVFGVSQWLEIPDYGDYSAHDYDATGQLNNSYSPSANSRRQSTSYDSLAALLWPLPSLDTEASRNLRELIYYLIDDRPAAPKFLVMRDDSRMRSIFLRYMVDDRSENNHSYYEFLQYLQNQARR